ncbi:MAG: PepSY domain-containing protein [Planctomycetota bacterium]
MFLLIEAKLKRTFWIWHFWAGVIAAPVLFTLSVTGAFYIFKPELELWWYSEITQASFNADSDSLEAMVERSAEWVDEDHSLFGFEIEGQSGRAPAVLWKPDTRGNPIRRIYVDPKVDRVLGEVPQSNLFTIVLAIHRRLMLGTAGRVLTELATGWTIVLISTGLVLWWPRSWKNLRGVLVPRLHASRYVKLRDLHTISGVFIAPAALVIAITGLLYALVWGGLFLITGFLGGQFDVVTNPPQSVSDIDQSDLGIDQVMRLMSARKVPTARMSIAMGNSESDPITIEAGGHYGPSAQRVIHLDRRTGEILADHRIEDLPLMAIYANWNYPLHVGSVGGMVTKIIWLIVSVGLAMLPLFGIWMWLTRRRPRNSGVPKRVEAVWPKWLYVVIIAMGIILPTVGLSMLLTYAFVRWRHREGNSMAA